MAQRIIINDPVAEALNRLSDQVIGQAVSSLNRLRTEKRSDARYAEQKAYRDEQRLAGDSLRELQIIAGQIGDNSSGYEYDQVYDRVEKVKTNDNPMVESLQAVYLEAIDSKRQAYETSTRQSDEIYKTLIDLEDTLDPVDKDGSLKGGQVGFDAKGIEKQIQGLQQTVSNNARRYTGDMFRLLQSRVSKIQTLAGISENIQNLDTNLDKANVQYGDSDMAQGIAEIGLEGITSALTQGDYGSAGKQLQGLSTFISSGNNAMVAAQNKKLEDYNDEQVKNKVSEINAMYRTITDLSKQLGPENVKARAILSAPTRLPIGERNFFAIKIQIAGQIGNILGHENIEFNTLKRIGEKISLLDGSGEISPYTKAFNNYNNDQSLSNTIALADELYKISKSPDFASVLAQSSGFDKDFFNIRQGTEQKTAKTYLRRLIEVYGMASDYSPDGTLPEGISGKKSDKEILAEMINAMPPYSSKDSTTTK